MGSTVVESGPRWALLGTLPHERPLARHVSAVRWPA